MNDLLQPLRNMVERYDKHKRLEWTQELITIYEESRRIIADYQQLFFMDENRCFRLWNRRLLVPKR